jgi:hypothetical protein
VRLLSRDVDRLVAERREPLGAEDAAIQPHVQADRRGPVDHDDASPVGVVEDVLG